MSNRRARSASARTSAPCHPKYHGGRRVQCQAPMRVGRSNCLTRAPYSSPTSPYRTGRGGRFVEALSLEESSALPAPRRPMRRRLAAVLVPGLLLGSTLTCLPRVVPAARFHDAPPIAAGALGAHLADGGLVVLTDWSTLGEPPTALEGDGTRYDRRRRPLETGPLRVDLDSMVLLETTVQGHAGEGRGGEPRRRGARRLHRRDRALHGRLPGRPPRRASGRAPPSTTARPPNGRWRRPSPGASPGRSRPATSTTSPPSGPATAASG
jgi:hypothetical protein